MTKRIAILGGGISGLAAAHRVTELDPSIDVRVLEASTRVGGIIGTEQRKGYVIEQGPDSFITEKPWAIALANRLGLSDRVQPTSEDKRGVYVVHHGKLARLPEGFSLLAPTRFRAFMRSPLVSVPGRLRATFDLVLPRGQSGDDESLASFVRRRFGSEVLERLAQPLAAGIYGADPERLSLRATLPRFLEIEKEARSVSLGLRRKEKARATGARYGLFVSFEQGMQTIIDALADRLGDRVTLSSEATDMRAVDRGFEVDANETHRVDGLIVALPGPRACTLLERFDAELAACIREIQYGSSATVTFAIDVAQSAHPLDAFGFVVPAIERRDALASTWASVKFANRAPAGKALIRLFLGGPGKDDIVERSDEELVDMATRELVALIGLRGEPELIRVRRYIRALPRYHVGHLDRVAEIERLASAHARFALAGTAYRGVGIPDAVRSGEAAAERVVADLHSSENR